MHLSDSEILTSWFKKSMREKPRFPGAKTAHEYAASLLEFVRRCLPSQVCVRKRVIGFWGANHSPTFGTVQSIHNDGLVRIV